MTMKTKLRLQISVALIITIAWVCIPAYATDWEECNHPRFLERGCGYEGEDGEDGADGADGAQGEQGEQGIQGERGERGLTGERGPAGEIPTEWITETRTWYKEIRETAAAMSAMQVYLPQDQVSRLTGGMSHVGGTTGFGIGFAYMLDNDNNSAFTLAVGHAGSETAVQGSFGFEFGGSRKMSVDMSHLYNEQAIAPEPEPVATGMIQVSEDEYNDLMVQAVQKEEFEEAVERGEYRYAQQQSLIEELQEQVAEHEDDDEKLERLKQEAAALRAAQEAEEIKQADIRAQFKRRYDARSTQGEDEDKEQ